MSDNLLTIPGLICCWDFNRRNPYLSSGRCAYTLQEGNGSIEVVEDGILSDTSLELRETQYLFIPRTLCPELNIHGGNAEVTVQAWIKRKPKSYSQCEAIAGMWNETFRRRQYCLFLNIQLYESADQVCGHVSGVGGPTPGQKWCIDVSIGETKVDYHEWNLVAFSYDGKQIRSYLNGKLDERYQRNPYAYAEGIFDGGNTGADFTVGAVHRLGEMGNYFVGRIGGLAVFDRTLTPDEIAFIHAQYPLRKV